MARLVESCPGTTDARADLGPLTFNEALRGDPDPERLRRKVRAVGKACAMAVAGLVGRLSLPAGEGGGAEEPAELEPEDDSAVDQKAAAAAPQSRVL